MKTIKNNTIHEINIKNSRFITCLYRVDKEEEINNHLKTIRTIYKDATHYCYAYILNDLSKSSDDNEPGGTAGVPIMQVLIKNNLNFILAIVIRYFGGIKLGSGGLVRAYTKSITTALTKDNIVPLTKGYNLDITFAYEHQKQIDYFLKNTKIHNKNYFSKITYNLDLSTDDYTKLKTNNLITIENLKEKYIEEPNNEI